MSGAMPPEHNEFLEWDCEEAGSLRRVGLLVAVACLIWTAAIGLAGFAAGYALGAW